MEKKEFMEQLTNLELEKMMSKDTDLKKEIQQKINDLSSVYKKELVEIKKQEQGGKRKW